MSSPISSIPILLLKTKSIPTDGYEDYFKTVENANYQPSFIPVLEHRFREDALQKIAELLKNNSFVDKFEDRHGKYGGCIFTSQRAVDAFAVAIKRHRSENLSLGSLTSGNVPFYVVGPATARGVRALELNCPVTGEETGNGEALAALILEDYNFRWSSRKGPKLPLLFLVGEQRRDIIPKTLQSEALKAELRIGVDEMVMYETGEMESFKSAFASQLSENEGKGHSVQWIVVFSPTGCRAMLETLGSIDSKTGERIPVNSRRERKVKTFVAAIGPTTRDFLKREFDFEPDVCAERPSPEGVMNGIASFMAQLITENNSTD